jgi:adenylate kinase family enzyme
MSKVIIINGPSCAGKTTIAKEIFNWYDSSLLSSEDIAAKILNKKG